MSSATEPAKSAAKAVLDLLPDDATWEDVLGIFDYIADQSPTYAESVYERILTRPSQLDRFPESGSIVPECDRPDIRELFV